MLLPKGCSSFAHWWKNSAEVYFNTRNHAARPNRQSEATHLTVSPDYSRQKWASWVQPSTSA